MGESKEFNVKVYSDKIKAGRRAYFFDIKPTKSGDFYLVITERKWNSQSGDSEKHRVFLYKEDLNKFHDAFIKALDHMKNDLMPGYDFAKFDNQFREENSERTENTERNNLKKERSVEK